MALVNVRKDISDFSAPSMETGALLEKQTELYDHALYLTQQFGNISADFFSKELDNLQQYVNDFKTTWEKYKSSYIESNEIIPTQVELMFQGCFLFHT
jgi:septation ring formation regulator EzrA